MAYQLIYTSSPVSLSSGRTGFCTVVRNEEISEKMTAILERFSVYDTNVFKGPVFSHKRIFQAGKEWHVLSRTCDAPADYTGRSNFIAHHLLVSSEEAETLTANPADILLAWDGWADNFEGEPHYLTGHVSLAGINSRTSLPASNWQGFAGDAGYAAILKNSLQSIVADSSDYIQILTLFSESLRLNTNTKNAWTITFTTRFFDNETATDFNWRVIPEPSKLAESNPNAQPEINFKEKIFPPIPQNRSAEYARSGQMTNREKNNLKVQAPPNHGDRQFNVVAGQEQRTAFGEIPFRIIVAGILGLVVTAVAIGVALYYLNFVEDDSMRGGFDPEEPPIRLGEGSPDEPNVKKEQSSEDIERAFTAASNMDILRIQIDSALEELRFEDALDAWRQSSLAKNDPSFENRLISRIGSKIDLALARCSEVFSNPYSSQRDKSQALKDLDLIEKALKSNYVPRKESKLENLRQLREKLKRMGISQ